MNIYGLQKTILLDYPEHVAATLFTGGCNFRCPYCHNSELLSPGDPPVYSEEDILTFLTRRKGILEGVCITGGEPTLQPDLPDFIRKVKNLGLLVKLDTNGTRPEMLKYLLEENLLDYAAMDIKNSRCSYSSTAGIPGGCLAAVEKSVQLLLHASIPYEFRTTAVRELHCESDFLDIAGWLAGCRAYFLQNYRDSEQVLCPGAFHPFKKQELDRFIQILQKTIPSAAVRGVD